MAAKHRRPGSWARSRRRSGALAALAAAGLLGSVVSATAVSATDSIVVAAADAYVSAGSKSTNFGSASTLKVDASPVIRSYLRFDVALPAGASITAATLRLHTTSTSTAAGVRVRPVGAAWSEKSITYTNSPAPGSVIASSGKWSGTGYKSIPLPLAGVRAGSNSFVLETTSTSGLAFKSRETTKKPQLVVSYTTGTGDLTPPETSILSGPADLTSDRTADFTFASDEVGSTFECRLDAAAFAGCTSPTSLTGLTVGQHTFEVRAIDPSGNVDASPAARSWVVDEGASSLPACGAMAGGDPGHLSKVVWIWFENKGFENLTPQAAPYFHRLKGECGYAANYTSVTTCSSLPEYIASTSGDPQGFCENVPPSSHPLDVDNVFRQISVAGRTFTSYQEGMPTNCARVTAGLYAVKHNPAAYYTGSSDAGLCESNDVPLPPDPVFTSDFTIIEPDLCHSMHDCPVSTGDSWLRGVLPAVLASDDYVAGNTAVFITFDEGGGAGGEVLFTLVLSPYTPAGTVSTTAFTHYSLLATLQKTLGLPCLLNSCSAADMGPDFFLR